MSEYIKQTWVDGKTPVDAEHMNHLEEGVAAAHKAIAELQEIPEITDVPVQSVNGKTGDVDLTASDVGALPADAEIIDKTARAGVATLTEEIAGVEPHADDIPRIYFGASIPQNKNETVMKFRYASRTLDFEGYCETKAQGNSSMAHPKKNQTTKLFDDLACKTKHKIDFKGWGKQNKFCLKANWIDLTHARNIVSARLWGDVVKSRAGFDTLPELMRTSPNYGAVDGFPVRAFANGKYQGRYTINIPKDKWMANMDDKNPNHCILCGENYVSGCFRAEAKIDGSDWTDEVHDVVPDNIKTRWNQVINFVMTATDDEFVANLDSYIDLESAIDYYLFGLAVCNLDGFGKNQLYLTYDGIRWYASAYDMDSTFGLYPDANGFIATNYPRGAYEDFVNSTGNLLYVRLANLFSERIIARWEQLRHGVLSANHIIERFERFSEVVPPYMIAEDYAGTTASGAFVNIPLKDSNNIQQIRAYTVARLAYVHEYLTGESVETNLWSLEGKTQRYFAEFKFPTDAITFEDGYYNGANRAGYWEPDTNKHPNLTINGNDFAVANTQSNNTGYGLGVPIDLTPGATYKISYSISGPAIVSLMYYGDDGIYIGRNELNEFGASGECEITFTIPDCKTVIFHAACDEDYDPDNPPVATYSNIEIVQL